MGNVIELQKLIRDTLNNNCVDPYNGTRPGGVTIQFYTEQDGLNLNRPDTFPKGFIREGDQQPPTKSLMGKSGWSKKYGIIDIDYIVKEKHRFTHDGTEYKNEGIVQFMLKNIQDVLLNNFINGYYNAPEAFNTGNTVNKYKDAQFHYYVGTVSVTYYWFEKYGE